MRGKHINVVSLKQTSLRHKFLCVLLSLALLTLMIPSGLRASAANANADGATQTEEVQQTEEKGGESSEQKADPVDEKTVPAEDKSDAVSPQSETNVPSDTEAEASQNPVAAEEQNALADDKAVAEFATVPTGEAIEWDFSQLLTASTKYPGTTGITEPTQEDESYGHPGLFEIKGDDDTATDENSCLVFKNASSKEAGLPVSNYIKIPAAKDKWTVDSVSISARCIKPSEANFVSIVRVWSGNEYERTYINTSSDKSYSAINLNLPEIVDPSQPLYISVDSIFKGFHLDFNAVGVTYKKLPVPDCDITFACEHAHVYDNGAELEEIVVPQGYYYETAYNPDGSEEIIILNNETHSIYKTLQVRPDDGYMVSYINPDKGTFDSDYYEISVESTSLEGCSHVTFKTENAKVTLNSIEVTEPVNIPTGLHYKEFITTEGWGTFYFETKDGQERQVFVIQPDTGYYVTSVEPDEGVVEDDFEVNIIAEKQHEKFTLSYETPAEGGTLTDDEGNPLEDLEVESGYRIIISKNYLKVLAPDGHVKGKTAYANANEGYIFQHFLVNQEECETTYVIEGDVTVGAYFLENHGPATNTTMHFTVNKTAQGEPAGKFSFHTFDGEDEKWDRDLTEFDDPNINDINIAKGKHYVNYSNWFGYGKSFYSTYTTDDDRNWINRAVYEPNKGYQLKEILFNGTPLTFNGPNYPIIHNQENTVEFVFEKTSPEKAHLTFNVGEHGTFKNITEGEPVEDITELDVNIGDEYEVLYDKEINTKAYLNLYKEGEQDPYKVLCGQADKGYTLNYINPEDSGTITKDMTFDIVFSEPVDVSFNVGEHGTFKDQMTKEDVSEVSVPKGAVYRTFVDPQDKTKAYFNFYSTSTALLPKLILVAEADEGYLFDKFSPEGEDTIEGAMTFDVNFKQKATDKINLNIKVNSEVGSFDYLWEESEWEDYGYANDQKEFNDQTFANHAFDPEFDQFIVYDSGDIAYQYNSSDIYARDTYNRCDVWFNETSTVKVDQITLNGQVLEKSGEILNFVDYIDQSDPKLEFEITFKKLPEIKANLSVKANDGNFDWLHVDSYYYINEYELSQTEWTDDIFSNRQLDANEDLFAVYEDGSFEYVFNATDYFGFEDYMYTLVVPNETNTKKVDYITLNGEKLDQFGVALKFYDYFNPEDPKFEFEVFYKEMPVRNINLNISSSEGASFNYALHDYYHDIEDYGEDVTSYIDEYFHNRPFDANVDHFYVNSDNSLIINYNYSIGEIGDYNYIENTIKLNDAPEGKYFSHWEINHVSLEPSTEPYYFADYLEGESEYIGLRAVYKDIPESINVHGTVLGDEDAPIVGANVFFVSAGWEEQNLHTTTNEDGEYTFNGIPWGEPGIIKVYADGRATEMLYLSEDEMKPRTSDTVQVDTIYTHEGVMFTLHGTPYHDYFLLSGSVAGVEIPEIVKPYIPMPGAPNYYIEKGVVLTFEKDALYFDDYQDEVHLVYAPCPKPEAYFDGWTCNGEPIEDSHLAGDLVNENDEVHVVAQYQPEPQYHFLTIKYVSENGWWLHLPYISLLATGDDYRVESPEIDGYETDQKFVEGTMGDHAIHETVTYRSTRHWLTISYVSAPSVQEPEPHWVALPHIELLNEGEDYSVNSPKVLGYKADKEIVEGTMGSDDINTYVSYTQDTREMRVLRINYVSEKGWMLALPFIGYVAIGDDYSVKSPEIDGYTLLDPDQDVIHGTMDKENIEVDVVYKRTHHWLTITYTNKMGLPLALPYLNILNEGEEYSVESPDIEGYKLVNPEEQSVISGKMGDHAIHEQVVYRTLAPELHWLNINYVDQNGNWIAKPHIRLMYEGDFYSFTSPEVEGYELVDPDTQKQITGYIGDEDVKIDVQYKSIFRWLRIDYLSQHDRWVALPHISTHNIGDYYKVESPETLLYELVDPSEKFIEGKMGPEDEYYVVRYKSKLADLHFLTIKYVDDNESWLKLPYVGLYKTGEDYNVKSPEIDGYELINPEEQSVISGTMRDHSIHEVVKYRQNVHTLTINYVDEEGTALSWPYSETYKEGEDYAVTSPGFWGYSIKDPEQKVIKGTMGTEDIEYTVTYKVDTRDVRMLRINYVTDKGWMLRIPYIDFLHYGDEYSVESPAVDGYSLVNPSEAIISGTMYSENITKDVVYKRTNHWLTITYTNKAGFPLALPYLDVLNEGDAYDVESPEVYGYKLCDPSQKTISGIMGDHALHFQVKYRTIAPENHWLTIKYVNESGLWIHLPYIRLLTEGDRYSKTSPEIEGYTLKDPSQKEVSGVIQEEDVTVKVVYINHNHWLRINYITENGFPIRLPYLDTYVEGEDYNVESPKPLLFELVDPSQETVSGTMGKEDVEVDVYYRSITEHLHFLTIKYVDQDKNWISLPYVGIYWENSPYDVESPEVYGYEIDDTSKLHVTGVMGTHSIHEEVTYHKVHVPELHFLTIKYVMESGWWLRLPYIGLYWEGADYSVKSPVVEGYELVDPSQETVSGTMGDHSIHEEVVYRFAGSKNHNLYITYVDEEGEWLHEPYSEELAEGTEYSVKSPVIYGYELVNPSQETISGKMGKEDVEVAVAYKSTLVPTHKLTINYVDEYDIPLADAYEADYRVGDGYNIPSPIIEGYVLVDPEDYAVVGTMGEEDIEVDVYYREAEVDTHTLTIFYENEEGYEIASKYQVDIEEGEYYYKESPEIEGFELVNPDDQAIIDGIMGTEDIIEHVIYKEVTVPVHSLTIYYVDENEIEIADTHYEEIAEGKDYSVNSPEIEDFELVNPAQKTISGTMGTDDIEVTVVYKEVSVPTHSLTIHYHDVYEEDVAAPFEQELQEGTKYSIESPTVKDYKLIDPEQKTISGTMGTEDIEVIVYYEETSVETHVLTINYLKEDGSKIHESYVWNYEFNEDYSVESPVQLGYTLVDPEQATVHGKMGHEDITVDVYYKLVQPVQEHVLTIEYVDVNGKTVSPTFSGKFFKDEKYSVVSPVVEGYELVNKDQAEVKGVMGDYDISVKVTYNVSVKPTPTPTPTPEPPHVTPADGSNNGQAASSGASTTGDNLPFVFISFVIIALIAIAGVYAGRRFASRK